MTFHSVLRKILVPTTTTPASAPPPTTTMDNHNNHSSHLNNDESYDDDDDDQAQQQSQQQNGSSLSSSSSSSIDDRAQYQNKSDHSSSPLPSSSSSLSSSSSWLRKRKWSSTRNDHDDDDNENDDNDTENENDAITTQKRSKLSHHHHHTNNNNSKQPIVIINTKQLESKRKRIGELFYVPIDETKEGVYRVDYAHYYHVQTRNDENNATQQHNRNGKTSMSSSVVDVVLNDGNDSDDEDEDDENDSDVEDDENENEMVGKQQQQQVNDSNHLLLSDEEFVSSLRSSDVGDWFQNDPFTAIRWKLDLGYDFDLEYHSPEFDIYGKRWKILFYPHGNTKVEHDRSSSVYLSVSNRALFSQADWLRDCRFSFHILPLNHHSTTTTTTTVGQQSERETNNGLSLPTRNTFQKPFSKSIRKSMQLNRKYLDWGFHAFQPIVNTSYNVPLMSAAHSKHVYIELRMYHYPSREEVADITGTDDQMTLKTLNQLNQYAQRLDKGQSTAAFNKEQWIRLNCTDGETLHSFLPLTMVRCPVLVQNMNQLVNNNSSDACPSLDIPLSSYSARILIDFVMSDRTPKEDACENSDSVIIIDDEDDGVESNELSQGRYSKHQTSNKDKTMDILELYLYLCECRECDRLNEQLFNCLSRNITGDNIVELLLTVNQSEKKDKVPLLWKKLCQQLSTLLKKKTNIKDSLKLRSAQHFQLLYDLQFYRDEVPVGSWLSAFDNAIVNVFRTLLDGGNRFQPDVTLFMDEERRDTIEAHKIILSVCCPYFRIALEKDKGNTLDLFNIEDFSEYGESMTDEDKQQRRILLRQIIEYLYTGRYTVSTANAFPLLSLCSFLGLTGKIEEVCQQMVSQSLQADNVLFILSRFSNLKHVREQCIEFIARNWVQMTSDYTEEELCARIEPKEWLAIVQTYYKYSEAFQ